MATSCEKALFAVGFHPLYPECCPSMFWHPKLKLLLGVYVDDFKMSGPSNNIDEGWNSFLLRSTWILPRCRKIFRMRTCLQTKCEVGY